MTHRRILYVSGTRADFGLMQSTLEMIAAHPALELGVAVTGMHLSQIYGSTVEEIEAAGLPIVARIPVSFGEALHGEPAGASMARNIGLMLGGLVDAMVTFGPDMVLLLGDRGEMLAGALAAIHLNVPVVHIHGGERSGTVDEPVRHAISKLAHFHLVSTEQSRERLIGMGEFADRIEVVGAPGLDGIRELAAEGRESLFGRYGLDASRDLGLLLYHPVLQEAASAGAEVKVIVEALMAANMQVLALRPNSDAGSAGALAALEAAAGRGDIALVTHLPRRDYLALLRHARMLVGNSSSGIIEAATFGTAVVNVGSRQSFRERNANVVDTGSDPEEIAAAVDRASRSGALSTVNVYGDGLAGERIVRRLVSIDLGPEIMKKVNAY